MSNPRHWIVWLTLAAVPTASAEAGCCDWLFGRQPVYAAQYAPTAVAPAYSANYGALPLAPRAYAPGAYQVQRPAYFSARPIYVNNQPIYVNNPSVYSGRPVIAGQPITAARPVITTTTPLPTGSTSAIVSAPAGTVYRAPDDQAVPLVNDYRGSDSLTVNSIAPVSGITTSTGYASGYGSYPSSTYQAYQVADTVSPGLPTTTVVPSGTPPSAYPVTPVAPAFAPPPQRRACCLTRFFSALFGTNYQTSYYRAPITYYRPVTTVDPVSGSPVVVQRPCTSTVQRLQRTPIATVQMPPTYSAPAPNACPTTYSVAPTNSSCDTSLPLGSSVGSPSSIGQVGATAPTTGSGVAPIPSTMPYSGSIGSPNASPLRGSPSGVPSDSSPVDRPALPAGPTESSYQSQPAEPPSRPSAPAPADKEQQDSKDDEPPASYWEREPVEDSVASFPPAGTIRQPAETPKAKATSRYTGLAPIPAPEGYRSPLKRRSYRGPSESPSSEDTFEAPPLPPANRDAGSFTERGEFDRPAGVLITAPVREASLNAPAATVAEFDRTDRIDPPANYPRSRSVSRGRTPVRDGSGWRTVNP